MENIILQLEKANDIAILAHISEDPDAIGSSFAMAEVLENMGKKVVCYLSEEISKSMQFLNRNYVVYTADMQVEADLCICLDAGDIKRLGDRINIFNNAKVTVNIDHHYTNDSFADYNWIDGEASATGEMLYRMFNKMNKINEYTAKCLYTAIATDTGCFKYSNVKPDTLRAVANLLEYNINHADITKMLFDTEELSVMKLKAEVMSNIKSYYNGKLNMVIINSDLFSRYGVDENDVGAFVNIPRRVAGTEVAVCLKQSEQKVKISLRSNGKVNVAEIAAQLGGGGHKMAAGAAVEMSLEDTQEKIAKLLESVI